MSIADSFPGMKEAKEAAGLLNVLRGFKAQLGEIVSSAGSIENIDFGKTLITDDALGYRNKPLSEILDEHPELKNSLDGYLDKKIYHGMRGYFLRLYDKTAKTINGVQNILNSGEARGLEKLVVSLEKEGAKEILLPVAAFTYVVGKVLLTVSGYGAGIYGMRGNNYMKDMMRPMADDFRLQASSLLSVVPFGNKVSELFHLTSIDNRVQELIEEKASVYVINSLRKQRGLEPMKDPLNLPGFVDKANEYYKSTLEPKLQEYGHAPAMAYEKFRAFPGYVMKKMGYGVMHSQAHGSPG